MTTFLGFILLILICLVFYFFILPIITYIGGWIDCNHELSFPHNYKGHNQGDAIFYGIFFTAILTLIIILLYFLSKELGEFFTNNFTIWF